MSLKCRDLSKRCPICRIKFSLQNTPERILIQKTATQHILASREEQKLVDKKCESSINKVDTLKRVSLRTIDKQKCKKRKEDK